MEIKAKINKWDLIKLKKLLHNEGNYKQGEKTTLRMGENNICSHSMSERACPLSCLSGYPHILTQLQGYKYPLCAERSILTPLPLSFLSPRGSLLPIKCHLLKEAFPECTM